MKPIRPIHDKNLSNLRDVHDRVHTILNGNVSLGSFSGSTENPGNIDNRHVIINVVVASNTEFAVTHNLNRVPTGFHVVRTGLPGLSLYDSGTAWTPTQIFLKSNTANPVAVLQIY
jgi:hypothetical protein